MDLEMHNFQQHTEVRWLSIGPAIKRVLEQWEAICQFVNDLSKDAKKVPEYQLQESVHAFGYKGESNHKSEP